jgi:phosphopantothenoylcysteine decarboxylase/phosphopantothenate--cysteine ligase
VATQAALKFVGVATLEGLTREKVGTELFADGAALDHITFARWADVTVVCPATANTLNRMAAGLGDDLAGALLLAHDWSKPLVVAPAMNPAMWSHPATVTAVARLREWGVRFVEVGAGRTACGEVGEGRLAEPLDIVTAVETAIARPVRRLREPLPSDPDVAGSAGVPPASVPSAGGTAALQ